MILSCFTVRGAQDLSAVEAALSTCVPPDLQGIANTSTVVGKDTDGKNIDGGVGGGGDGVDAKMSDSSASVGGGRGREGEDKAGTEDRLGGSSKEAMTPLGQGKGNASQDEEDARNPYVASEAQGGSADYTDFVKIRSMVSRKATSFFTPRTFLRFPRDVRGRVSSDTFFKHVYESVSLQKTKLTLQ